jgi:hypothetical protein
MKHNRAFCLSIAILAICAGQIVHGQSDITRVDFTRFANNQQIVITITTDSVFVSDNIRRTSFRAQGVLRKNQYQDWKDFSVKLEKAIVKFKKVKCVPQLYDTSANTIETRIYITKGKNVYEYSWSEKILPTDDVTDSHFIFDNCFLKDEDICWIYIRLIK